MSAFFHNTGVHFKEGTFESWEKSWHNPFNTDNKTLRNIIGVVRALSYFTLIVPLSEGAALGYFHFTKLKKDLPTEIQKPPSQTKIHETKAYINVKRRDTQALVPVTIEKYQDRSSSGFNAYTTVNGSKTLIGNIQYLFYRQFDNGLFGASKEYPLPDYSSRCSYGLESDDKINKIWVNSFDTKFEYCGVGKALLQAVIEYSYFEGCEGRISLDAVDGSHGFYYKMGLRTDNPSVDAHIRNRGEGRVENPKSYHERTMYLYEDGRKEWERIIKSSPLFPNYVQNLLSQ